MNLGGHSAPGDVRVSSRRQDVDIQVVTDWLLAQAYWGRTRTRAQIEFQVDSAWAVASAHVDSQMVGFARAVSDGVALGYLADVFVLEGFRGRGIGQRLVREVVDEAGGREFRWLLHTADAQGLYQKFGFARPDETLLERPAAGSTT